jgi:hypothetical protein
MTCVNKMLKTCKNVLCFDFLDAGKIVADIKSVLKTKSNI